MWYLALLGGSYCSTQSTSGMSIPRAITSVHTKTPLQRRKRRREGGHTSVPTRQASLSSAATTATVWDLSPKQRLSKDVFVLPRGCLRLSKAREIQEVGRGQKGP